MRKGRKERRKALCGLLAADVYKRQELITPIAIEEGLRFAIREGGRTVGSGVVSKINE